MTKEELAEMLNNRAYLHETNPEIEQLAKDNNLLIVFGCSDDLCEFRGAIFEEFDCYEGGTIRHKELPKPIEALWCSGRDCSWSYETELPYAEFNIYEDDELYCIGMVVDLNNPEHEYRDFIEQALADGICMEDIKLAVSVIKALKKRGRENG